MTQGLPIRLVNLHKSFHGGRDQILRGISLNFEPGKLTYILGPSGTGKSVTIKHILGLLKPDSGEVWVGDKDITKLSGPALQEHRELFGMLFQNAALFDELNVFDNVAFPLYEHTRMREHQIRSRVTEVLNLLGMNENQHRKHPNELSGGMKKRVGLARAIIRQPRVLLYDEPTTGLDPVTRITVDEMIEQIKREFHLTSIVISHDIPSALRLADQIAFLFGGEVVFFGTPSEFRNCQHPAARKFLDAEASTVKAFTGTL